MTNLNSEQYREVLKRVPNATEETPTTQTLLRKAVQTFYKRFGGYPQVGGVAPGKVGIFGDQIQFDDGIAMPLASQMVTVVVGKRVPGKRYSVATSENVGNPHKVSFSFSRKRPLAPGCPKWLNAIKGVIEAFGHPVPPFEAVYETSFPESGAFGRSASLEVAFITFLEILVGKRLDPIEKAKALERVEEKFGQTKMGLIDRLTSIMAEDRNMMVIDCKTHEVLWIPFKDDRFDIVVVDARLPNYQYIPVNMKKYLAKASELLGVENLRHFDEEEWDGIESKLVEILERKKQELGKEDEEEGENNEDKDVWTTEEYETMVKRVRYYLNELRRIDVAIQAWLDGNLVKFAEKMKESHQSAKEEFDFDNPIFDFLVEVSLEFEAVFGSKVTGSGLGFGIISFVQKGKCQEYCQYIKEKFAQNKELLTAEMREMLQREKLKQHEYEKSIRSFAISPSEKTGENNQESEETKKNCLERQEVPCIVKVEKKGRCGTWAHFEELLKKDSIEKYSEEGEFMGEFAGEAPSTVLSEVSLPNLKEPLFYRLTPFAGARMLFVTKTDLLRSRYAIPLPHPKDLANTAINIFKETYDSKVEHISLAPGSVNLFGEFMEYHLGYLVCMTLPMYVVTVGGRNDSVFFTVKTTLKEAEPNSFMKYPLPCVRSLEMESRSWANNVLGVVHEFKGQIPGFDAVVHSSIPIQFGMHSCAAFLAGIYVHLENMAGNATTDPFEKIEKCHKSELEVNPDSLELINRCSSIKYFPIFLCQEGHLTCIDCKKSEIQTYYFDDPNYVFLIASCKKNTSSITLEALEERLKHCRDAIDILGRISLLNLDFRHLKCLKKREAAGEVVKRAKYVITEHQRTLQAIKAMKEEDYDMVGKLMTQSHISLRDDYEVSSPQIDELFQLATSVKGVLGAKMLGRGLIASVIILINLSEVDNCIKYMRKKYSNKNDKPVFYVTKPSGGAFSMDPKVDLPYIL